MEHLFWIIANTTVSKTPISNFYLSNSHPCSYLPGRQAMDLFVDPYAPIDAARYSQLISRGFRRSGKFFYRPHCPACDACIPLRIPVQQFQRRRIHKRIIKHNHNVNAKIVARGFLEEHYQLYRRYITTRHRGGGMDKPDVDSYISFLCDSCVETAFIEFRLEGVLIAVAVTDWLDHGLSSVYTFFDPNLPQHSLGVYCILWQIAEAKRRNLPFVYLGYWIKHSNKMNYKMQYQPAEIFRNDRWSQTTENILE